LLLAGCALAGVPARAIGATAPSVAAQSWIVVDGSTGVVIAQRDPDRPMPAASLQKMLTALLVVEHTRPSDAVRISADAAHAEADHVYWPQGATFTVEQLLYGMMLESSNGAAIALAEHVAGNTAAFSVLMDEKVAELGATHSRFVNPDGLDATGQVSSARDLSLVARAVLADPLLGRIVATRTHAIPWPGGSVLTLHTIDRFLLEYPGAIGVKSGYTTDARNCLAAAAERHGRVVLAVVLRSPTVTADATALMDDAFRHLPPAPAVVHAVAAPEVEALGHPVQAVVAPRVSPWKGRLPSTPGIVVVAAVYVVILARRTIVRVRA
jgi:D-alanyl-D-alanine carboxypeptidase (penicillin-binding protein 5/6)